MAEIILVIVFIIVSLLLANNRKDILWSIVGMIKALLKLLLVPTFQIVLVCGLFTGFMFIRYFSFGFKAFKLWYLYIVFFVTVIISQMSQISMDTKMSKLFKKDVCSKFSLIGLLSFIMESFEPSLLISFLIVFFFVVKTLFETLKNAHSEENVTCFPITTMLINICLLIFSLIHLFNSLSYHLFFNLLISFILPCIFWLINFPLLVLIKYLMELDITLSFFKNQHQGFIYFKDFVFQIILGMEDKKRFKRRSYRYI